MIGLTLPRREIHDAAKRNFLSGRWILREDDAGW
jgi:hypothetical protein